MSQQKPSILLLSTSSEVVESVLSILDSDYEVIRAKTLSQSFDILDTKKTAIAIIDFAAATSMNGDTINQLKKHKPDLITILICPRDKRDQLLESNLSNETYRVLFATLSPGQTRLAVAAGFKHAKAKASEMPKTSKVQKPSKKTTAPKTTSPKSPTNSSGSKLKPIIASVAVIAVAGAVWMFLSGDKTEDNDSSEKIVKVEKTQTQIEVENLSIAAKTSLDSGILFPPKENNALDTFSKILQLDPNDFAAKKALIELSQSALGDLDLQIENGSKDDSQASISFARELGKNNPAFLKLVEDSIAKKKFALIENIEATLGSGDISEAASLIALANDLFESDETLTALQKTILEQQSTLDQAAEINRLLDRSKEAITANRLLTPDRDNAQYFINRLESLDPDNSALDGLKRSLTNSLLLDARSFAQDSNFASAKRYVDTAANLGASPAAITNERQRIISLETKLQEEQLAIELAEKALAEEELVAETERLAQEQADVQAEAAEKAETERQAEFLRLSTVPVNVSLSELTTTTRIPPEYPDRYLGRGLEGSADIAFTLSRDGVLSDVRVLSTTPDSAASFGRAALAAVQKWEFEPYKDEDGNTRIAKSQIRINFQL